MSAAMEPAYLSRRKVNDMEDVNITENPLKVGGYAIPREGPGSTIKVYLARISSKEQVADILGASEYNRKLRTSHINHLRAMMERGTWSDAIANISFDWYGKLINGHHTLNAMLTCDPQKFKPIVLNVLTGLPPESYGKSNNVTKTTTVDLLGAKGVTISQHDLAAAGRMVHAYQKGRLGKMAHVAGGGFDFSFPEDVAETVTDNPGLSDHITVPTFVRKSRVPCSAYQAAKYLIIRDNHEKGPEFFKQLSDGLGYTAGSPVRALREKIINCTTDRVRGPLAMAWIFKAWNAFAKNQEMRSLTFRTATKVDGRIKGGEEFPELEVGY